MNRAQRRAEKQTTVAGIEIAHGSDLEVAPPANVPIIASIHIVQLATGQIVVKSAVANRIQFNMLMTTAMQDMIQSFQLKEAETAAGKSIIEAPPGLRV